LETPLGSSEHIKVRKTIDLDWPWVNCVVLVP
jgi:hypothetical protein